MVLVTAKIIELVEGDSISPQRAVAIVASMPIINTFFAVGGVIYAILALYDYIKMKIADYKNKLK
jgi:hypothetical protein